MRCVRTLLPLYNDVSGITPPPMIMLRTSDNRESTFQQTCVCVCVCQFSQLFTEESPYERRAVPGHGTMTPEGMIVVPVMPSSSPQPPLIVPVTGPRMSPVAAVATPSAAVQPLAPTPVAPTLVAVTRSSKTVVESRTRETRKRKPRTEAPPAAESVVDVDEGVVFDVNMREAIDVPVQPVQGLHTPLPSPVLVLSSPPNALLDKVKVTRSHKRRDKPKPSAAVQNEEKDTIAHVQKERKRRK